MNPLPTVTAVMLTTVDRKKFWGAAMQCFIDQTYPKHLRRILMVPDGIGLSFGAKRNLGISRTTSELVIHWDDDDWSHPARIANQVARLLESGLAVTGYRTLPFYDVRNGDAVEYHGEPNYACDATLCFRREYAIAHPYPDAQGRVPSADNTWIKAASAAGQLDATSHGGMMVARIHGANTGGANYKNVECFRPMSPKALPAGFRSVENVK